MILSRTSAFALAALAAAASSTLAEIRLGSMFGDHMVLQREIECPLWGTATPASRVEVFVDGKSVAATTSDAGGAFRVRLPSMADAGPHRIEVRSGDDVVALDDVLVGEVWLCSGQSNMEWPVTRAADPEREVASASTQRTIRLYQMQRKPATQPATSVASKWTVASSETIAPFSAVAYFFARDLKRELNVPIGLIHSSWGGTPAESWTPLPTLKSLTDAPRARAMAMNVDASGLPDAADRFQAAMRVWMEQTGRVDTGVSDAAKTWADPGLDTASDWRPMTLPTDVTKHGVPSGSITWFRREIDVPADRAGKDLVLTLGIVDDFDITYFNGERVGATVLDTPGWWAAQRRYVVPGALVKAGRNVIAVRAVDLDGPAGLAGPAGVMRATFAESLAATRPTTGPTTNLPATSPTTNPNAIALNGPWQHCVERTFDVPTGEQPPRPLPPYKLDSAWTPATLYNGMIAPVDTYAIRGAIWYQGESNAGRHAEYAPLLGAMIGSWREQIGVGDFPFYIVGLANFRAPTEDPNAPSDWAHLRDAQRRVSRELENAALSVTIDIGEAGDIHPKNKQEVGRRLALLALEETYGKEIVSRGPTLKTATFEGGRVVLQFDHVGSGLAALGDALKSFAVAGDDGTFVWANARIDGDRVVVESPAVATPTMVRYAWADNPKASLFNKEGLPAEPFEVKK